jgi:hypothetical protein
MSSSVLLGRYEALIGRVSNLSEDEVVRAMVMQASMNASFTQARDIELVTLMMQCFVSNGVGFDRLTTFRSEHGRFCTGLWHSRKQSVGVSAIWIESRKNGVIIAQIAEGEYRGEWIFTLDTDQAIMTSHDDNPVASFNRLEGVDLLRTVVQVALTAPESKARRWWPL